MTRTLHNEERSDVGASAPIERPRVVERLAASAARPITLLIAPPGYGKTVALRQYLHTLSDRTVLFALRPEHSRFLGFLRGLTEALRGDAPHATAALAGAYERNPASENRADDLARWMEAHLESFTGVIAIDDLHAADRDAEVAQFVTSLIGRTKTRVRWILSSRSTAGLAVGTWLAYGDADSPIDESDLRLTLSEARNAANGLALTIGEEELRNLLALTEGWPAAMNFALRTSTRSTDLRSVSALTREMIYRLLAEQIHATLDEEERNLLDVAMALPVVDVAVLERAGFDRALPIVERLRQRTALIYKESPGIYQCHDLFREFLRHQTALEGKHSQQSAHARAAAALEANGDVEHAIASYVLAGLPVHVLRLLERHGFDLIERARGDVVAHAIENLDEKSRRENPSMLALQGNLQSIAGKFARAEALFRRALARAEGNRDLIAIVSLRLASLIGNQGRDVSPVLRTISSDVNQQAMYRAEALSLMAAREAIAGDASSIDVAACTIEALLPEVSSEAARARVLHHLGIVNRHLGNIRNAIEQLEEASSLACDLHCYALASRTFAVLSNLALHEQDNVVEQLRYATLAAEAATKGGDAFACQTALLQMLSAQMRSGDIEKSLAVERKLLMLRMDNLATHYVMTFKAVRLAWEEQFAKAHELLASSWKEMPFPIDRAFSGAQLALFLAVDNHREASIAQAQQVMSLLASLEASGSFDRRTITISQIFCALAEFRNGRYTHADRILRRLAVDDEIKSTAVQIARQLIVASRAGRSEKGEIAQAVEHLGRLGYGDVAAVLAAVSRRIDSLKEPGPGVALTPSECSILRSLAAGLVAKDIAADTRRSVHTVRAHIANAIAKLDCQGSLEAVRVARLRGLI